MDARLAAANRPGGTVERREESVAGRVDLDASVPSELGTDRPIFSSRCEVPQCEADPFFQRRYTLAEIENERRVGYAWYGNWPARALATTYPAWRERWLK